MSTAQPDPRSDDATAPAAPVAADRPVVNGAATPQELRDEVQQERDPERRRVEELRAEVGETAEELSARLDVPARLQDTKDRAVAGVRAAGYRARDRARENPAAALAGPAALLLVLVVLLVRRARR